MKFKRNITFFAIITFLTMSVVLFETSAQTPVMNSDNLLNQFAGNSVEGVWNLNTKESDDPIKTVENLIRKSFSNAGKTGLAEKSEKPGISISIFPPERLVLADGGNEMTINEFYTDVVSTRTFITDGQTHIYHVSDADIAVNAIREMKKLSITTLSPRGNRMMETFELSADGSKLQVIVRILDSNFQESLILHRIYDRTILDDFSNFN